MVFKLKPLSSLLIITASPVTRNFFSRATEMLESTSLIHSETGLEAFGHLSRALIICIVIDDNTPDMDLPLFCENIRLLPDHRYTPILVISSTLKKKFMRNLLKAGATDFLRHPLDESDFLSRFEVAKKIVQTENKMAELTARLNAIKTNPLPLKTHTILDNRAIQLIISMIKEKKSLALLILEIDQFKKLSPLKRKKMEAELLKDTENALKILIRQKDLLFNQNQGKFIVVLSEASQHTAKNIAEKIKNFFITHVFSIQGITFPLTVSIGSAVLRQTDQTKNPAFYLDHLLREAQTCLNEAKKLGNAFISTQENSND